MRLWGWPIALALLFVPGLASAQMERDAPCFDVAVVASLVRQTPQPFPDDPDVIVMRWPWVLDFETEQVLVGREDRGRFRAMKVMHAEFRSDIEHFLLFLRRDPRWGYVVVDMATDVVVDRRGEFVIPFEAPLHPNELGWYPPDYESYLRPIHYRVRDAWWLAQSFLDENELRAERGWTERQGDHLRALRGLRLRDLRQMMDATPGAICMRPD